MHKYPPGVRGWKTPGAAVAAMLARVTDGEVVAYLLGDWPARLGIALMADRLSGWMLAVTWLNPHVYLDTVVLLGGVAANLPAQDRLSFGLGAMLASWLWFFALAYGARLLAPLFARPNSWRVLDIGVATVMLLVAWQLVLGG